MKIPQLGFISHTEMIKLTILVSGNGSNLQHIINAINSGRLSAKILKVIADRQAYGIQRAIENGIPNEILLRGNNLNTQLLASTPEDTDLIVLAGFLSILDTRFCEKWDGKIINLHPSLLPKYGGKGMYGDHVHRAVLQNNEKESGITVHLVTPVIDGGQIILQKKVTLNRSESLDTIKNKIQNLEKTAIVNAIKIYQKTQLSQKSNILIVGGGGREYAIGKKLKESSTPTQLYFAKGNGGTKYLGTNIPFDNIHDLLEFSVDKKIDLVIVGSEELLVEGIVDHFQEAEISILGPHKKAALLEGSKAFSKKFMQKYNIPTASFEKFTDYHLAKSYLKKCKTPIVIKASGLAGGKGVIISHSLNNAQKELREIMIDKKFGCAGDEVVIEEFLDGKEISILSFYNGEEIFPFISAKDHKKIHNGEKGLNTGGMGTIAPNPYLTPELKNQFIEKVLLPTADGLRKEELQFKGVIFFGLMISYDKIYVLEYNLRMGDPETQAVLPLMKSDFLTLIKDTISGKKCQIEWKNKHACCVVMASGGYPQSYEKGYKIEGIENVDCEIYFAGVKSDNENFITSGGRVLNVVGLGKTKIEAQNNAYQNVKKIHFKDMQFRTDIGD